MHCSPNVMGRNNGLTRKRSKLESNSSAPMICTWRICGWQIEYFPGHFERIHHVRKKYACAACESNGGNPRIETAAKLETAIDKGLAGPGLLSYIVTAKAVRVWLMMRSFLFACLNSGVQFTSRCPNFRNRLSYPANGQDSVPSDQAELQSQEKISMFKP